MNRTVYKIKHENGTYFNGNYTSTRFAKLGKSYLTMQELKEDLSVYLDSSKGVKRITAMSSKLSIVKEKQTVLETPAELTMDDLQAKLVEKAETLKKFNRPRSSYLSHVMSSDLALMFPAWDIGEFVHVVSLDYGSVQPFTSEPTAAVVKAIGAKRNDFVRGNRTIAFKDKKFVMATKLLVQGGMEYVNLAELSKPE